MSEHADTAGDWAFNKRDQTVAAWDKKRVIQGKTYEYFCICGCGDTVTLHRGEQRKAHFSYKAHRRDGCKGAVGCEETEIHYQAKWLLSDIFTQVNFWRVCGYDHRVTKNQYTGPEWTATVEKGIPGTNRIADVLLENSSTKQVVALEVKRTHAVTVKKKEECELVGVTIIEVEADEVTPECRDLHNGLNIYESGGCGKCVENDLKRKARQAGYLIWKEQNERYRQELEEMEREQLRVANAAREEQMRVQKIDMDLQDAARAAERELADIGRRERQEVERLALEESRRRARDASRKLAVAQEHAMAEKARAKAEQELVYAAATRIRRRAEMAAAIAKGDRSALWAMGALNGPVEF